MRRNLHGQLIIGILLLNLPFATLGVGAPRSYELTELAQQKGDASLEERRAAIQEKKKSVAFIQRELEIYSENIERLQAEYVIRAAEETQNAIKAEVQKTDLTIQLLDLFEKRGALLTDAKPKDPTRIAELENLDKKIDEVTEQVLIVGLKAHDHIQYAEEWMTISKDPKLALELRWSLIPAVLPTALHDELFDLLGKQDLTAEDKKRKEELQSLEEKLYKYVEGDEDPRSFEPTWKRLKPLWIKDCRDTIQTLKKEIAEEEAELNP